MTQLLLWIQVLIHCISSVSALLPQHVSKLNLKTSDIPLFGIFLSDEYMDCISHSESV